MSPWCLVALVGGAVLTFALQTRENSRFLFLGSKSTVAPSLFQVVCFLPKKNRTGSTRGFAPACARRGEIQYESGSLAPGEGPPLVRDVSPSSASLSEFDMRSSRSDMMLQVPELSSLSLRIFDLMTHIRETPNFQSSGSAPHRPRGSNPRRRRTSQTCEGHRQLKPALTRSKAQW